VRRIDRAQAQKPKIAEIADRFAREFVIVLLAMTAAVTIAWLIIDPAMAFWVAVAILAITCPCSLSLATPAAIAVAVGRMTRNGLLVTRGYAMESLASATHVVFDKTGTLTDGHISLQRVQVLAQFSESDLLRWAGSLEQQTEHPVGLAIARAARQKGALLPIGDVQNFPGRGMRGTVDGRQIAVGNQRLLQEIGVPMPETLPAHADLAVMIVVEHQLAGVLYLSDNVRPDAMEALQEIRNLGLTPVFLSGDQPERVALMARSLGIEQAHGGLLPAEKLEFVHQLQQGGAVVLMVGDGINDAPVLSQAQVSMAMGGGTVIAKHSADIVLINDQLQQIPYGLRYARRVLGNIHQNLWWSVIYNAVAIPLAATGLVQPWMAAIGMSLSSILVVGNALRLRRD
jgi:Cu2+-exporting ATPase